MIGAVPLICHLGSKCFESYSLRQKLYVDYQPTYWNVDWQIRYLILRRVFND